MRKALVLSACLLLAGCGNAIGSSSAASASQTTSSAAVTSQTNPAPVVTTATPSVSEAQTTAVTTVTDDSSDTEPGILSSPEDIGLYDTDGSETNYSFVYNGETFAAVYTPDNWKIYDSYKITVKADIELICEALISVHPIHGADYESWRTADDLAFEWQEHNAAFMLLPESSKWKDNVRDVDLNPEDQGKTGVQMALERLRDENS